MQEGFQRGTFSCGARLPLVRWRALRLADRCAHHFLPLSAAGSGRKCCLWSVRRGFQRGTHRKGSPWHLLRYPKPAGAAIAAAGFDRCANKSSLHRPLGALGCVAFVPFWRQHPRKKLVASGAAASALVSEQAKCSVTFCGEEEQGSARIAGFRPTV